MKKSGVLFVSMLSVLPAHAAGLDANKIFIGGGLSINDIGYGDDATGFQVFGGIPIPVNMGTAKLSAEVGYMNSGNFEKNVPGFGTVSSKATGLWANAVIEVPVGNKIDLIGRAGLDIGDDDGLMIGGGIGVPVGEKMDIRFEYVVRQNIDSLQANIVIGL